MSAVTQSVYEMVGTAGVKAVVERFYQRVLANPELAPYFAGMGEEGMARVKRHQVMLVSQVLGGPTQYDAGQLGGVHARLNIEPRHYRITVHLLVGTMWEFDLPADTIFEVAELLASLQPVIAPGRTASVG